MDKKAIMGIGTLIIFIATILVAAVAAGVIISTSGVLQQKALLIGEQSQNRLINGVQITHVFMAGDVENKTANNIEVLARPEPASGPINFKTTTISFFTDERAYSASLSHPESIEVQLTSDAAIDNSDWYAIGDLDDDGIDEQARLSADSSPDYVEVNMSEDEVIATAELTFDAYTNGLNVSVIDLPIEFNDTVYGYVHYNDSSTTSGELVQNGFLVTDEIQGECTFEKLRPETSYCIVTMNGIDDTSLEYGETVFIYFQLKPDHVLDENDEFELKIFPQDGRSTFILDRVPQAIYKTRMSVFP